MSEYNTGFSEKLIDAAQVIMGIGLDLVDAKRTVLYLSLLSCEIALKALLERAGKSVAEITRCSHDFKKLLDLFNTCQVEVDIANGHLKWVSAVRIRTVMVDPSYGNALLGNLLEAKDLGASQYPNQIRYGDSLKHYPPEIMLTAAKKTLAEVNEHWNRIRIAQQGA